MRTHLILDDGLFAACRDPFVEAGYEVSTVAELLPKNRADLAVIKACVASDGCLVTSDPGFAEIRQNLPDAHPGIVVLLHPRPNLAALVQLVRQVVRLMESESPRGRLWLVEPGFVRVHEEGEQTAARTITD